MAQYSYNDPIITQKTVLDEGLTTSILINIINSMISYEKNQFKPLKLYTIFNLKRRIYILR